MIVPFDPQVHERFVFSGFCNGAGEPWEWLHRLLRHGARCAVRVGSTNRNLFYGFAVVTEPQVIAWCYTKKKLQGHGVMTALLGHLGVDIRQPMVALLPSPAAEGLRRHGWPISYPAPALPARRLEVRADGRG